ncbi:hypothetical protein EUTSA_v10017548mg, partial [Eutrema salsugineum]
MDLATFQSFAGGIFHETRYHGSMKPTWSSETCANKLLVLLSNTFFNIISDHLTVHICLFLIFHFH